FQYYSLLLSPLSHSPSAMNPASILDSNPDPRYPSPWPSHSPRPIPPALRSLALFPRSFAREKSSTPSLTYPSGRSVAQTFDLIGRLSQVSSSAVNYMTIPSSTGYNAANELPSATYGNGVAATITYNTRL